MRLGDLWKQSNFFTQSKRYNISVWQHPQFLFLVLGFLNIIFILGFYRLAKNYSIDEEIMILFIFGVSVILFLVSYITSRALERLLQVSKTKSEFMDIIAHQLRRPLTNLKWTLDFFSSEENPQVLKGYSQVLKDNISRLEEMVSDLNLVSKLETAKLPTKREEVSLEDLVKEILFNFQPVIKKAGIEIILNSPPILPKVLADSLKLKQVIENLLDNAIRYSREKSKIEINLKKKEKNLYFEIKDQGIGIPKKDQRYIFKKFFRSSNASTINGAGLGLYITKLIIEEMKGKIGFFSQEGKGSTFWFTLPFVKN